MTMLPGAALSGGGAAAGGFSPLVLSAAGLSDGLAPNADGGAGGMGALDAFAAAPSGAAGPSRFTSSLMPASHHVSCRRHYSISNGKENSASSLQTLA